MGVDNFLDFIVHGGLLLLIPDELDASVDGHADQNQSQNRTDAYQDSASSMKFSFLFHTSIIAESESEQNNSTVMDQSRLFPKNFTFPLNCG